MPFGHFAQILDLKMNLQRITSLLVASSSLRSNTESEDELAAALFPEATSTSLLDESCGGDVEDETLPELADNPGTTKVRNCTFADDSLPFFGQPWLLTA